MEKEISTLDVHRFDASFYDILKRYLEAHGVNWLDVREGNQLMLVRLRFPPFTTYKLFNGEIPRYQITLPQNGVMYWDVKDGENRISVPYMQLMGREL